MLQTRQTVNRSFFAEQCYSDSLSEATVGDAGWIREAFKVLKGRTVKKRVRLFAVAVCGVERLTGLMQAGGNGGDRERRPVSFPDWKSALAGVEIQLHESYRQEVVWCLTHG